MTPLYVSAPLSSSRILITILSPVAEQRRNLEMVYRHLTDRINIISYTTGASPRQGRDKKLCYLDQFIISRARQKEEIL